MKSISNLINHISSAKNSNLKTITFSWITQNNNNTKVNHNSVQNILKILRYSGYIRGFDYGLTVFSRKNYQIKHQIIIHLKYDEFGKNVINWITLISTPSIAKYATTKYLWQLRNTPGLSIISTPIGIITDDEARRYNVGGYLLFTIG